MNPAEVGARASGLFDMEEAPVAIVGAGPVGMTCALRLADFGIASVVLEANSGLLARGSKACLIHGDALEILDKTGCAEQISREGVPWRVGHTYVRGVEIRRTEYPRRLGFGEFVNISQYRIEQILNEAVTNNPLIRVDWSNRVTGLSQDRDGVTLCVDTPDGKRRRHFLYVVACDGVKSTVRELAGAKWTGYTHRDRFLITDIKAALPITPERHFHYDSLYNPGRQLVIHPQPHGVWRIDWQLPPNTDIEAEQKDGRLDRRIRAVIGDAPYEIKWLSTYRFHQRVARRFRIGRIFLAGDAAHAFPPYGSRGMNSGIQDADNLAWKLGAVLSGEGREDLLETFHEERHAAALENLRVTEATIRFMIPPNPLVRVYRDLILRLSALSRPMRDRVNSGTMTAPFRYTTSRIVDRSSGNDLVGAFMPDMPAAGDPRRTRLRHFFGRRFAYLLIVRSGPAPGEFVERARALAKKYGVHSVITTAAAGDARPSAGMADQSDAAVTLIGHHAADIDRAFPDRSNDLYLIRPDSHVAGAYRAGELPDLAQPLSIALGLTLPRAGQPAPRGRRWRFPRPILSLIRPEYNLYDK
jgi:3-(3-hydroxy-phenyl)propionate hydroxylase